MRQITIVNQSSVVSAADFAAAIAALQIQLSRDFAPAWDIEAQIVGATTPPATEQILILDNTDQADALGYHTITPSDQPVGYVFAKTTIDAGDHWQATLSHELLEELVDPLVNSLAGPLTWAKKIACVALEVADPVENSEYDINGIPVSDFVTPLWFQPNPAPAGTRYDQMGLLTAPLTMTPGGYVAYLAAGMKTWSQTFAKKCPKHQRSIERYSRRHRRGMAA